MKSKLILKIYCMLPAALKSNPHIISFVQPIAEHQLQKVKQEYIRSQWQKVHLEKELHDLKPN